MSSSASDQAKPLRRTGRALHLIVWVGRKLHRVTIVYTVSLLLGAALFSLIEGVSFFDSLYWAVTTAMTIGYGDISPATVVGKLLFDVVAVFWCLLMNSLFIANLILLVIRDNNQFSHLEQEWIITSLQRIAEAQGITLDPPPADTAHGDVIDTEG